MTRICSYCGDEFPESHYVKTSGNKCKKCRCSYMKEYNMIKRLQNGTHEEKEGLNLSARDLNRKKHRENSEIYRKAHASYMGKKARMAMDTRKESDKKAIDREIYVMNEYCKPIYYLDFAELGDIPIERLDVEYYEKLEPLEDICLRTSEEFMKRDSTTRRKMCQYEKKVRGKYKKKEKN